MSWDVALVKDGAIVTVPRHSGEGGTYVLGGTTDAKLTITYNYGWVYRAIELFEGSLCDWLNGQRAGDMIPALAAAVARLGTGRSPDYWAPTCGNAGHALSILLEWARLHPDAVFAVD